MSLTISRRRFLTLSGAAVVAASAGCLGSADVDDVTISNGMSGTLSFEVVITQLADDSVVVDRSGTIEAGGTRRYADPIQRGGPHRVQYRFDGEIPEALLELPVEDDFEWDVSGDESFGLRFELTDDGFGFSEGNVE